MVELVFLTQGPLLVVAPITRENWGPARKIDSRVTDLEEKWWETHSELHPVVLTRRCRSSKETSQLVGISRSPKTLLLSAGPQRPAVERLFVPSYSERRRPIVPSARACGCCHDDLVAGANVIVIWG